MPPTVGPILLAFALAYAIGAIPFGYLIARMKGVNLFEVGSGNIGATNVGRILGKKYGIIVFLLDFAKGAVPVLLGPRAASFIFDQNDGPMSAASIQVAAALGAFIGHMFPVYLRFRGGKGVATGCGTVFVLVPGPAAVAILIWLAVVSTSRIVSLSSICAALALVTTRLVFSVDPFGNEAAVKTWFCIAGALLVSFKHRENLRRLLNGTESQLRDAPFWHGLGASMHVVAMGTWFGAALFFNFLAAPAIFESFKEVVKNAPSDRTAYVPIASAESEAKKGQLANALAGAAVGPLFPRFFGLQTICGVLALITALSWWYSPGQLHRWRVALVGAALITAVAGWPISNWVSELRVARFSANALVDESAAAAFRAAHVISLLLSLVTAILAFFALVLAGRLPARSVETIPTS